MVLLVTDGVFEAHLPSYELFGKGRMLEVARANRHRKAGEIIDKLHRAVGSFTRRRQPQDDLTTVVVKVKPQ
jgi:serine phosphatase RsbU (regulator of sigma subunit)